MRAEGVSPWGTLVFEVMSQQTPLSRVEPIWNMWMERWSHPRDLAQASTADVLAAWDHLGYPSRALRLQQCARTLVNDYDGEVPADVETLQKLPGVGPYTASAVSSFVFHRRVAVLDVNIRRVFSRVCDGIEFPSSSAPTKTERARAESFLPDEGVDCAMWNVAVMELGALVCTQRSPDCDVCPVATHCAWRREGYPPSVKRPKGQAWKGTDRQARGRVMALLREAHASGAKSGTPMSAALPYADVLAAATLPHAEDVQAVRVFQSLLADGLVYHDDETGLVSLPQ